MTECQDTVAAAPSPPPEPLLVERPIFIVGDGRSGTTLMRSMLSAHSRIAVTPETQYMARAEAAGRAGAAGPDDFDAFWRTYTAWVRFQDLDVDPDRCLELVDRQGARTFKAVFSAVLAAYLERLGKERVGEKSPGHLHHLERLFEWFPDALVIALRRDPRAVVASKMHTPWVTSQVTGPSLRDGIVATSRLRAFVQQVDTWVRCYEEVLPRWEGDPRVLVVPYEELVGAPEEQLRAVCAFLGEVYEPTMLTGRTGATVPPSAAQAPDASLERWRRTHEARSLAPVSADSLERWREELSSTEVAVVEGRCSEGMRTAGYVPSAAPLRRRAGRGLARLIEVAARAESAALPVVRAAARSLRRSTR